MSFNNMKRLVLLVLICMAGVVMNNCIGKGKPEPRNLIRGTVTDSVNGEPVDSPEIVIRDTLTPTRIFFSNSNGWYQAYPDTIEIAQVFCRKAGYSTKITTVDLTKNKDIYDNVNFELVPE